MSEAKKNNEFEDGKPVEEYLIEELNKLEIEPEHSPQATQRMETVAEEPVRNTKDKEQRIRRLPTAVAAASAPPVQTSVPVQATPPIQPATASPTQTAAQPIQPQPAAIPQETLPPQAQTPAAQAEPIPQKKPMTIDEYIKMQGAMVKQQYVESGEAAEQAFINNSYRNLAAVINGEVALVPVQQLQPQPEPEPQQAPAEPVDKASEQIRQIDIALKEQSLHPELRAKLTKKKLELLGISIEDVVPAVPVAVAVPPKAVPTKTSDKPRNSKIPLAICICGAVGLVITIVLVLLH